MSRLLLQTLLLADCVSLVYSQNITAAPDGSFPFDPILWFRPNFARSFPVQILMTGILLSLTVVLLFHLLFTAQYHWPLGRTNYILQLSSVFTLLISLVSTLVVVLLRACEDSSQWPYMIFYLSINVPPSATDNYGWSNSQMVAWYVLDAVTSGLVQITHVQFLTFLYPSHLEARLIFSLLAPLTLLSVISDLMLSQSPSTLASIAESIRNICSAALSILFTGALFLWGLVLHRPRSRSPAYPSVWRTDGGTAAFGLSALFLAASSTAINVIYIPSQDHYVWMRQLIWTVTLWQSFLGWWWWVGAGVGSVLETESLEEKLQKQERRRARKKLKLEKTGRRNQRAKTLWKDLIGKKESSDKGTTPNPSEVSSLIDGSPADNSAASSSTQLPHNITPISWLRSWWMTLRQAHQSAARAQAAVQHELRQQVYGKEITNATVAGVGVGAGMSTTIEGRSTQVAVKRQVGGLSDSGDEWGDMPNPDGAPTSLSEREPAAGPRNRGNSLFWWGPLQQWRLQDSTSYPVSQ